MARTNAMVTKPTHAHQEILDYDEHGRYLGTCRLCGQVKEYDPEGRKPPLVIKEGNMDPIAENTSSATDRRQRHGYYEQHKAEILNDLESLGLKGCLSKWRIPNSSWVGLKRRWGLPLRRSPKAPSPNTNPGSPDPRPPFPAFNETWQPAVKLAWLETYAQLFGKP